jgi:hypothetical protein
MRGCLELFREEEEERLGFWPQPSMKLRQRKKTISQMLL